VPTYDYRCKACGQELEVFQSFSDDPLTTCDACGGELRKLFGAPGIAFKGSGFYKTDSRSGTKKSAASSSEKSTSDASASSSSDSSGNGSSSTKKEPAASSSSKSDAS
jgi:putative FmdB family regulatory protein